MVFSSLPIFLDPPNWGQMQMQMQQQPLQCLLNGVGGGGDHHHLMPPPSGLAPLPGDGPADTAASAPAGGGSSSSTASLQQQTAAGAAQPRPVVSMAERARLARVPLPEPGTLRCPRCDSANTKFCYFNNYSLSQPRHFCKACRRYWTRGGALRNVPVGGGCRRNTKRSSSKKSSSSRQGGGGGGAASSSSSTTTSASTATTTTSSATAAEVLATMQAAAHHQLPHLAGLPPAAAAAAALEASLEGYHHYLPLQMQPHQFLQQAMHGYHFADGDGSMFADGGGFPRGVVASGLLAQLAAVKMEEHNNGAGGAVAAGHEQSSYWPGSGGGGGNGWPAEFLSGFSSSSSGNVL